MTTDRRQLLLNRTFDILSGMTVALTEGTIPAGNIARNRNQLPADLVPGILVLDADETRDPRLPDLSGRDVSVSPGLMRMTPEIYIVLDVRTPHNKNVSEDLGLVRMAILNKIFLDPALSQLTGSNGTIVYDGCVTDLARNRVMKGQMGLSITYIYPFSPKEFV